MASEQETDVIDRILSRVPVVRLHNSTIVWLALGTVHGAWLIEYGMIDGQLLIWMAIAVAALAQIGGVLK